MTLQNARKRASDRVRLPFEVLMVFPAGSPVPGAPGGVQVAKFKDSGRALRRARWAVPLGARRVQVVRVLEDGRRVVEFEAWAPGERPDAGTKGLPLFS